MPLLPDHKTISVRLLLFAALVGCFAGTAGGLDNRNPKAKPNIILIFSDDHGYCDLGGQRIRRDLKTPHLDRLIAGGVRFTNGYVTAPQCVPSRAGILTGRYQNRFGVEANQYPLGGFHSERTIAERLQSAGYATGMSGKWHLGPAPEIVNHGFDDVYFKNSNRPGWSNFSIDGKNLKGNQSNARNKKPGPENSKLYHIDANTEAACNFIKRHHDQPFFFYCAYRAPHVPLDAPEKYLSRFSTNMPKRRRQALAMISAMDDGVGRISETLRHCDIEEQTLIFFIGDNGAPLKIHKIDAPGGGPGWDGSLNEPLNGEKGMLTEGGIRVPFVAYWKGRIKPGRTFDEPVISLDVAATAVELAGLVRDPKLDGVNLIPSLDEQQAKLPQRKLYWRWVSQSAIRDGRWKFLKGGSYEYLFDLHADREEKKNLIKTHPDIAKRLKSDLIRWSQDLQPPGIEKSNQAATWNRYFEHYLEGNLQPRPKLSAKSTAPKNVQGWIVRGGSLRSDNGVLRVTANPQGTGKPFLVMNRLDLPTDSSLRIQLRSDRNGKTGVSWREQGQKDFKPKQVHRVDTEFKGQFQRVELEMKSKNKVIHIRVLLPGKVSEIKSIEILNKDQKSIRKWDFSD